MNISFVSFTAAAVISTCAAFAPPNGAVRIPILCSAITSDDRRNALGNIAKLITGTIAIEDVMTPLPTALTAPAAALGALVCSPRLVEAAQPIDEIGNMGSQTPLPSSSMSQSASTSSDGVFIGEDTQFQTLPNGVKIKDFKIGTGTETITSDSQNVSLQMNGRLINTNAGITFYNTKNNNPDGFGAIPLRINLSRGEALPGLESGVVGMKKNGIRRIVVPAGDLSYNKYPNLEPKPMNDADQRALDSIVKNSRRDSTIMFDVKVERFSK